jgi:hypothetical protein
MDKQEKTTTEKQPEVDNALQGLPDEYVPDADIPYVKETPGLLTFSWPTHSIEARVTHFDNLRDHADIEIWYYVKETGHEKLLLPKTDMALKSVSARHSIANQLEKDLFVFPWEWIITCIAYKCIELSQRQNPSIEIISQPGVTLEPDYLLKPILYRGHPTVIFGAKESTKSLLSLVIAYIVQLPLEKNGIGFTTDGNNTHTVLFCDYEDNEGTFTKRWTAIQNGFKALSDEIPADLEVPIWYKHMTTRPADSVESLRPEMIDKHVGLLIVDSLGPAARGKLNDPEPAIEYHAALRSLGVTSLTLAHNAKDPLSTKRSIFGSVYFTNLARSIWECKAESYPNEPEVLAALSETNANLSSKHGTLGIRYNFNNRTNTITVTEAGLEGSTLSDTIPLSLRIKNLLRSGAKTLDEMATELDADHNTVKTAVWRLTHKQTLVRLDSTEQTEDGKVVKVSRWGLKQ